MTDTRQTGSKPDAAKPRGPRPGSQGAQPGEKTPMHDPNPKPTPDHPHQHQPIQDPPVHPEHDPGERKERLQQQPGTPDAEDQGAEGVRAPNPSPDRVVFDENEQAR